jgi:hypothetical protein
MLKRLFGPKEDEVTCGHKKSHDEEFSNLYSSLNIVRMIKTRKIRWKGHAACTVR